jgi:hypothetical protein
LVSRDVAAGTVISTSSYYALVDDLRRCWIHQTGSLDGFIAVTDLPQAGDPVSLKLLNTLTALTATVTLNAYATPPASQLAQDSLASSTATVYASNALTYSVDYAFTDADSANYFFNLGGRIAAGLSHAAGSYVGSTATWAGFVDWANSKISSSRYGRTQWTAPSPVNTSYTSSTNCVVSLGIFAKDDRTIRSTLTVTNVIAQVSIPTTATSLVTYSVLGDSIQGYYGVASPRPQASVVTSFGSGQTPPTVPTRILIVSQPTSFAFPSNSNSDTQTVTITNAGNSTCTVSSITYPDISYVTTDVAYPGGIAPPWTVDPGASHTFNVRYFGLSGLAAGTYAGYFSVYSPDAITSPVTVNTQLVVAAPVFDFYLSPDHWNSTYTYGDKRLITQSVNVVAKDNFTTISYGTDTNFLSGGFTIKDSSSVVGFDIAFNPIGLANATYITTATIGINSIQHKFTATIILNAPAAPVTQHLGDWVSAYQLDNGVIGASYDVIDGVRYITLGFGMGADGGGNFVSNPAGSNVHVANLGTGSDVNFALGPVLYPAAGSVYYSDFLNPKPAGHGVWVNDTGWSPVNVWASRTYTFTAPSNGSYTYTFAADNQAYFTVGGQLVGDLRNPDNGVSTLDPVTGFFTLATGVKTLTVYFYNTDNGYYDSTSNPGSVALTITDPTGSIVWDSNLPVRTGYTAYQYWNEVCRIPLYDSTTTDAVYYSKDYIIKNLCPLYGQSYGSYFGDTGSVQEGSMFTVTQSPFNDITIALNSKSTRDVADKTTNYASYLLYYYTDILGSDRLTQLEPNPGTGNSTHYFTGFDRNGTVTTALLSQPAAPYVPPAPTGGGGSGGGGGCPDPATPITVSESGYTRPAGQLVVGNRVWTRHETTGVFGSYPITAVEIVEQQRVKILFDDGTNMIVSDTHKFLMQDLEWRQVFQLSVGDTVKGLLVDKTVVDMESIGVGPVVKITVDRAHTYVASGLISHNVKIVSGDNVLV